MTILVTGSAGFIGAHVSAALLARGESVLGIDNLNAYYPPALKRARLAALVGDHPRFRFAEADFADSAELAAAVGDTRLEAIVHLGAQAGVRHSITAPRDYLHSNLAGHLEILELARHTHVRRLVYASSSSVYGDSSPLPFSTEHPADQPVSFYAATKRANEIMSESYAHLYRLPQTGLRFFTVYGPWGRPDMAYWSFTDRILKGESLPVFNGGKMKRDFTFISDIVAGVLTALDRPPADDGSPKPGGFTTPHAVYNLGNDAPSQLGDFIAHIARACGRDAILDMQPMQPGDVTATWADISAARRDLGYDPKTPLAEGIPAFVDWYRRYTDL
jgi:UDP-glucuronate 4-epimerase